MKKAFTLVEILIVLAVISSLLILGFLAVPSQIKKARDAARKAHLNIMKNAINEYYQDTDCYPQTLPLCENPFMLADSIIKDTIPCDPFSKQSYVYVSEISQCPSWYQLYANLEYTEDKIIDKVGCRNGCGPDCQFNYGVASANQVLNPYCEQEASQTPPPLPAQYACAPGGGCSIYVDPEVSGCPNVYPDDPTCQDACSNPKNRCHDARGKQN